MAVSIRLRRGGKKKRPFYRIVAADSRSPRDGSFLEIIGHYNPIPENEELEVKIERFEYWLGVGAKPSDTVRSLLKRKGLWAKITGNAVPIVPQVGIDEPDEVLIEEIEESEIENEPTEEIIQPDSE